MKHGRSLSHVVVLLLAVAVPAQAQDPKPAPPTAPATVAPALAASAFQAAKLVLAKLEDLDPRGERLALASLDAARVAPSGERGEFVRIHVDLTLAGPDPQSARAALAEWIEALKKEKAVVGARPIEAGAIAPRLRVEVEWDPSKAPARAAAVAGASTEWDSTSYIWVAAAADKVEVGYVRTSCTKRRIPGTDWVEECWTIASKDPARTLPRLAIHNFATVLESRHPYASVTRYAMLAASGSGTEKRMELELTLLRPARAEEPGTGGKR